MRIRLLTLLIMLAPIAALCQEREKQPGAGLAFGLFAHSYGFGLDVQYLTFKGDWDFTAALSFSSFKHRKELKIESAYSDQGGKDYIYDKKNYAYILSPMIGVARTLIPKSDFNRVSVRTTLSAGPTLALLKPYYLEVAVPFSGNQALVEVHKYDATKYNYTNIVGEADYFLGMNEIQVLPGLRGKLATLLDFSSGPAYIRGVELGMFADLYAKKLDLLDLTANRQFFVGGSVEILVGNAW